MFNAYTIILALFIACGVVAMAWGWRVIALGRQSLHWPSVEGRIVRSEAVDDMDDLVPHIEFSYRVNDRQYISSIRFPADITPTRELTTSYQKKYPAGTPVQVYFDPQQPGNATLEPGAGKGDWLIFAFGLGATVLGIVLLLF